MNKLFIRDSVLIADRDNPDAYALEVYHDASILALVDHVPGGPRTPFITLDREGVLSLLKELADFLVQNA